MAALAIAGALAIPARFLNSDTLYQEKPDGGERVIQQQAIVVRQDASVLIYKHFDLGERRITKVQLSRSSLDYSVAPGGPEERQRIVDLWKKFGYSATVTDVTGKATQVFDSYFDYYPPGGVGSLLESVPATTSLPLQLTSGGADVIDFSKILELKFSNGKISASLRNGRTESGTYLLPVSQPVEVRFLGVTNNYNPASPDVFDFSEPLSRLKEIRFQP